MISNGGVKIRCHIVFVSDHAWNRWQERVGKISRKKLTKLLTAKLNETIGVGLRIDSSGDGWVEAIPGVWAVIELTGRGWMVKTFTTWCNEMERVV